MPYEIKLKDKKEIAEGTMEFVFEKPKEYDFQAGQFTYWNLINPSETDEEGDTRIFSIVSAPQENYLAFSTRMRDTAFKRVLKNMNVGEKIMIKEPMGDFAFHREIESPAIFLVGGIGITPVMSILRNVVETGVHHKIYLFYSNRKPEDTAYLTEIRAMSEKNKNFIFVPTMTDMESSKELWKGETSKINMDIIKKYVPDITDAHYYITGPQSLVRAMRAMLNEGKVLSANINAEEFGGY